MSKFVKFTVVLFSIIFSVSTFAQKNFSEFEQHVDIEYLAKSAFVRSFDGESACKVKGVKTDHLVAFRILSRYESHWYRQSTDQSGLAYKTRIHYVLQEGINEGRALEFDVYLHVLPGKTPFESLVSEIYIRTTYKRVLHEFLNKDCHPSNRGWKYEGSTKVKSSFGLKEGTVRYVYLKPPDAPKNYRGDQYVFQAQKILADKKFELLGSKDVDGIFGPKTLEAFELFMALTDAPISFDGKTFDADLVAKMKSAYEAY